MLDSCHQAFFDAIDELLFKVATLLQNLTFADKVLTRVQLSPNAIESVPDNSAERSTETPAECNASDIRLWMVDGSLVVHTRDRTFSVDTPAVAHLTAPLTVSSFRRRLKRS